MARLAYIPYLALYLLAFSSCLIANPTYPQAQDLIPLEEQTIITRDLVVLEKRASPIRNYINVAQGLLRSKSIIQLLGKIPCSVVTTLTRNGDEAKKFVTSLESGKTPDIIKNLPAEVSGAFKGLVGILATFPVAVVSTAESTVSDIKNVFDQIGSGNAKNVPGVIASTLSKDWASITSGVGDAWNDLTKGAACIFAGNCPSTQSCQQGSSVIPRPTSVIPTTLARAATMTPVAIVPAAPVTPTQIRPTTVPTTQVVQNTVVQVSSITRVSTASPVSSASPVTAAPPASTPAAAASNGANALGIYSDLSVYGICVLAALGVTGVALIL